jgi:hypothetical protein
VASRALADSGDSGVGQILARLPDTVVLLTPTRFAAAAALIALGFGFRKLVENLQDPAQPAIFKNPQDSLRPTGGPTPQMNERGETLADVIMARRKRRFEESGETFEDWSQACFAGARSIGEIILRSRQLYREATARGSALGA